MSYVPAKSQPTIETAFPDPSESCKQQPQPSSEVQFEERWRIAQARVFAYCRRALWDEHAANEIVQRVALRAWRSFASFREEGPFDAWVMKIARRELDRHYAEKQRSDRREVLIGGDESSFLETVQKQENVQAEPTFYGQVASLVPLAVRLQAITREQSQVLLYRLFDQDLTWAEIGKDMNRTAADVAVLHWRAIDKFRVFLFLHCPERLGGFLAIERALAERQSSKKDRLTLREEEVFRHLVLHQRLDFRKPGWRTALSAACEKVARGMGR